jgi:hypothetical protein
LVYNPYEIVDALRAPEPKAREHENVDISNGIS